MPPSDPAEIKPAGFYLIGEEPPMANDAQS